ncbi:YheC/YheD family protein [Paenibacillus pinistramenti]|uniref:YheC/YheD family protein n=1 Tax=Paenibacillus pinistramenti TaxID=1768003 RepID=UPI001107D15F|nr:YheC/YheD family protein [Paenibacillus pinistramenti]
MDTALKRQPLIGMLLGWKISEPFLYACHSFARERGCGFYYFFTGGIDAGQRRIRGFSWNGREWEEGWFPYPDVVYDRYRRRWKDKSGCYDPLSGITSTHTLPANPGKVAFYRVLSRHPEVKKLLIPYLAKVRPDSLIDFLSKHRKVVLKPNGGTHGRRTLFITRKESFYEVDDQSHVHIMNRLDLAELAEMLNEQGFLVQKAIDSRTRDGAPLSLRVHLMKDGAGAWTILSILVFLSLTPHIGITNHEETFRSFSVWENFLRSQYSRAEGAGLDKRVRSCALAVAAALELEWGSSFHEIGLDLGIDPSGRLYAFESNVGNVGMRFGELQVARSGMDYAAYLAGKQQS